MATPVVFQGGRQSGQESKWMKEQILFSLVVPGLIVTSGLGHTSRHNLRSRQGIADRCGVVTGEVLDQNGRPVARAKVYSLTLEHLPRGRQQSTLTNEKGIFTLGCVELGRNSIYVGKEDEGYPDTLLTPFLDRKLKPIINVSGEGVQQIELRLPPKAARLNVQVVDAATRRPIEGATLTLCRLDYSRECHQMNANQTAKGFSQLLPPIALSLKASAPDHEDWFYNEGPKNRSNAMQLGSNGPRSLVVLLRERKPPK